MSAGRRSINRPSGGIDMMRRARLLPVLLLAVAGVFESGCGKKQAPRPLRLPPAPAAAKTEPPPLLADPRIDLPPATANPPVATPEIDLPPPPVTDKPQPKKSQRAVTGPPATPAGKPTAEAGALRAPQLGEVMSDRQRKEYTKATEESLGRTKRLIAAIERRPLDPRAAELFLQVQGFVRQAAAARADDLVLARNLANRAEVLAKDLLRSLN